MNNNYFKSLKLIPAAIIIIFIFLLFGELIKHFQEILTPTILTLVTVIILLPFKTEHRAIKILLGIIVFLYTVWFLSLIKTILIPFAVAIVLAYISDPVVTLLQKKGMSRSNAALLLIGLLILFFIIVLLFLIPTLINEVSAFVEQLPLMREKVIEWFNNFRNTKQFEWIKKLGEYEIPPYLEEGADSLLKNIQESLSDLAQRGVEYITEACSSVMHFIIGLLELFIIPVFVFYMLEETGEIKKFLISFIHPDRREEVFSLTEDINDALSSFLRGQLFNCSIIGSITAISFCLIGIKFPFMLGFVTGVMNFIPYIGNVLGPSPALLLAFFTPNPLVSFILVLITIAGIHLLDSYYLYPKVHGKTLKLSPLMIMMAVITGGQFYGAPGMFLAIPAMCVLKVLFLRWIKRYEVKEETIESSDQGVEADEKVKKEDIKKEDIKKEDIKKEDIKKQ